jgi:hypothetical protein
LNIHFLEEIVDAAPVVAIMTLVEEPSVTGVEIPPCLLLVLLAVAADRTGTISAVFLLPLEISKFGRKKVDVLLIGQYAHNKILGGSVDHITLVVFVGCCPLTPLTKFLGIIIVIDDNRFLSIHLLFKF